MDEFSERLGQWKSGIFKNFRKRWWWVLIIAPVGGFIWALIADRLIGATNRYIDAHVSIEAVRPILSTVSILSLRPLVTAALAAFVVFLGLVIHAYWETRGGVAIDGEIYRIVVTPKSAVYELYADALKVAGNPDGAVIDVDVLVEIYIVNQTPDSLYVREIIASVEIDGIRVPLERKTDFDAFNFSGRNYEYVTERPDGTKDSLVSLSSRTKNNAIAPGEPLEGWTRFEIKNVLLWKLKNNTTFRFAIVDSKGRRYPIDKVSTLKRDGEITARPRKA